MTREILWLAEYGVNTGLITEEDRIYTINRLMELFGMDDLGEDDMLDLSVEMEALKANCKRDGLLADEDFNVSDTGNIN